MTNNIKSRIKAIEVAYEPQKRVFLIQCLYQITLIKVKRMVMMVVMIMRQSLSVDTAKGTAKDSIVMVGWSNNSFAAVRGD